VLLPPDCWAWHGQPIAGFPAFAAYGGHVGAVAADGFAAFLARPARLFTVELVRRAFWCAAWLPLLAMLRWVASSMAAKPRLALLLGLMFSLPELLAICPP
jgi:hypothetical protein